MFVEFLLMMASTMLELCKLVTQRGISRLCLPKDSTFIDELTHSVSQNHLHKSSQVSLTMNIHTSGKRSSTTRYMYYTHHL
jgi:hypothetical protein